MLLRISVAVILLTHSIPGFITFDVNKFGSDYLNSVGFAPIGIALAWLIKLSHVATAICLLFNRFVKLAGFITIFIFAMGIIMVHFKEGWYVVGGGTNGIEYNVLLIACLLTIMFTPKKDIYNNPGNIIK